MGTNYYYHEGETCCRQCEGLHIGKSSWGWNFSLRIHPELGINSLADWETRWATGRILDEYGERVTPEQMLSVIVDRSHPNGLTSHVGYRCPLGFLIEATYGGETYDLCDYEFC